MVWFLVIYLILVYLILVFWYRLRQSDKVLEEVMKKELREDKLFTEEE